MNGVTNDPRGQPRTFRVTGHVRFANGVPATKMTVVAVDRDLRGGQPLGRTETDRDGAYLIEYTSRQFSNLEQGTADLEVRALDVGGLALAVSPVLFNAPPDAVVDLTIPLDRRLPPTLFERLEAAVEPLRGQVTFGELEEDRKLHDLSFLSGETGFDRRTLARFGLAHRLARHGLEPEFWFALLGGSLFEYIETDSLAQHHERIAAALPAVDARAAGKAIVRSLKQREIPDRDSDAIETWIAAFLALVTARVLGDKGSPTFAGMALEDAGVADAGKQAAFARIVGKHRALTPEALASLEQSKAFSPKEIADLTTSYRLADLIRADFSTVKMVKDGFAIREPAAIRTVARRSEREWIDLVETQQKAGTVKVPPGAGGALAHGLPADAIGYARLLERQFRDAFPTMAFAGAAGRASKTRSVRGMRHADAIGRIIDAHPDFDLLHTRIDTFLSTPLRSDQGLAKNEAFRLELKAVQRVFKLAPTFDAADAMLADGLHSAQSVYRIGESEFVRRFAGRAGLTVDAARTTWNRAADTHAAVLTIVGDLKSLDPESLPEVLRGSPTAAMMAFPNWENLFQAGDLCDCEHCRSVLSPAAYFADVLMFLRDRRAANPAFTVKDILFRRRADLGYIELNCENTLTTPPYVDIVCEVLERAIANGAADVELPGFGVVPAGAAPAKAAVAAALSANGVTPGTDFTLSQVDPSDPNRWVVHGDAATFLLKKKTTANFFAEVLPNTKAGSAELRAYPAYVNAKAYETLHAAKYPMAVPLDLFPEGDGRRAEQRSRSFALPFDLFAEEVRAAFQKSNVPRWELMRTLRGTAAPNNPTDGEIAAEYFGISSDAAAAFDERRLILTADATDPGQRAVWGETGNSAWLDTVDASGNVVKRSLRNVQYFLRKTGLEYAELLALLDLPFINPARDMDIDHLDGSCDTDKKVIRGLGPTTLDRFDRLHRFLRLWRKLRGWKLWEVDLAIRCPGIGAGTLDEKCLVNLFHLDRLKTRLGPRTTVEQLCGLFDDLNTETVFTKLHEKRGDGIYQTLFLNKKLIQPIDAALAVAAVDVPGPTTEKLSGHRPVVLAALSVRETDFNILAALTRASTGVAYITDDLTLANLSFLWRHAWLARLLKLKADEWATVLTLLQQDVASFADPKSAVELIERVDQLKALGFSDELKWLLAADRSAKAAVTEADAARFLAGLRAELQAIRREYDGARDEALDPPADAERLAALLTTVLQRLNRDEGEAQFFVDTLEDQVVQEQTVPDLPQSFSFPAAITGTPLDIPIRYQPVIQFAGAMTAAQRTVLLTDPALSAVTGLTQYQKAIADLFASPGKAAMSPLPAGFAFPATITGAPNHLPVSYKPLLRFTGLMTPTQRTTLQSDPSLAAVTGIASYQQAIDRLFQAPRLALKFLDPVFTAPLANLPAAADFKTLSDPVLVAKISYDAEERVLRVVGALSPDEKSELDALSADTSYLNAVNNLFTQPTLIASPPERFWLQDADLKFPLRDPANAASDNLRDNLATAVGKGLAYLSKTLSEGLVISRAGAQLGLTEGLTRRLLTEYAILPETLLAHLTGAFSTTSGVIDYATLTSTFDGWFWANRVAGLWKAWKLTLTDWQRVKDLTAAAKLLDFASVPVKGTAAMPPIDRVLRTHRLMKLRHGLPETQTTLLDVLIKLTSGGYAAVTDFAADVERMNDAWSAANVQALVGVLDLVYPADYLLAENWERMLRAFAVLDSLNADVTTVAPLAGAAMAQTHAATVKALLRSRYGNDAWLTLSAEIQDALRERKRDALAAYLLTQPQPADAPTGKWENTNDLYAHYLLDVEMGALQLTSRLVQGSGSVQLFVQRCFMGLEPAVSVQAQGASGDSAWLWWKWMRKYRVWEANRQVYLWPENVIEPELKIDRSPFFKDLETELLQGEINRDTVETAFGNYLEKLNDVAQLEVAAFYQEDAGDTTILHVFGRTTGVEPHDYYYRRFDYRQWSPWEKVALDIQGDYLIPAVANGRLCLYWPEFSEVPDEHSNSSVATPQASQANVPIKKARRQIQLRMAVSEYRQRKWTPKRVSSEYDYNPGSHDVELYKTRYQFFAVDRSLTDGTFLLKHRGHSVDGRGFMRDDVNLMLGALFGAFDLAGCKGVPVLRGLSYWENFVHAIRPERPATGGDKTAPGGGLMWYDTVSSKWLEDPQRSDTDNDFTLLNQFTMWTAPGDREKGALPLQLSPILLQTPDLFAVTAPWHLSLFDRWLLNANVTAAAETMGTGRFCGTWLPFFYKDKARTFFVSPALVGPATPVRDGGSGGGSATTQVYYPEMKRSLRLWESYFEGQIQTALDAFNPATLTTAQRQQLEQALLAQFPEVSPPPYPDALLKTLWKRALMRFYHLVVGGWALWWFQWRRFHFTSFYHPFVCEFGKILHDPMRGVPALMSRETQLMTSGFSFQRSYVPTPWVVDPSIEDPALPEWAVTPGYPKEAVDFSPAGAYSPYNWELFFHAPLLIANALSRNQRFEEARDWYHYIFNPIGVDSPLPGGSPMSKYWITKPFFQTTDSQYVKQRIENLLRMLAGDTTVPGFSAQTKKAIEDQVLDWRNHPFDPHRIANYRTVAYQKTVVMRYLDNLIEWGDSLFRQDSMESINEATQLYILAAELLGPRPKKIPPQKKPPVESFNELEKQLDAFANALVEVENLIPALPGSTGSATSAPLPMLYFCIPQNDKLLAYWDTVADRLYKIRHSMNIEGVIRQLALFEPPIDPAALVKAIAGGLDINDALADRNAPLPLYRFNVLLQKANEVCGDVKALGAALLAALEKKDAETLGLLRQSHEIRVLEAVKAVRESQIDEAKENLSGLQKSKELAGIKKAYYESREFMNAGEIAALTLSSASTAISAGIALGYALSGGLKAVPQFIIGAAGFGGSPHATAETGGRTFGEIAEDAAMTLSAISTALDKGASIATTVAGHQRRQDDWNFQKDLAIKEIDQLDRSIAAAELRLAIAEKERDNHVLQMDNAKAVDTFMRSKYTNDQLYAWQIGQLSGVYFQAYRLAFDLAKRAERCLRFEVGLQDSTFISFGYWDSLKKGLLSGDKLQHDLRRLEAAYLDQNRREFELTKHVSLLQLDPLALVQLRETGRCFFRLPEEIFDLDYPGHYMRRVKSVSITLPCVTGPYTTISCTLRLLKNSVRITTGSGDNGYPRNTDDGGLPADDPRFVENNIPVKAIAASSGQNDSGLFELSFRDERYLPFEGAGVISEWSLELFNDLPANNPDPAAPDFGRPLRQYDYASIVDAVMHVRLTAKEDAGPFKNGAISHLREYLSEDEGTPSLLTLDLRRDFGTAWSRFLKPTNPANGNVFELEMSPALFPFRDAAQKLRLNRVAFVARCTDPLDYRLTLTPPLPTSPPGSNVLTLKAQKKYGGRHFAELDVNATSIVVAPNVPATTWKIRMTRPGGGDLALNAVTQRMEVEDLVLVLGYAWE